MATLGSLKFSGIIDYLKREVIEFNRIPLLSARDIKGMLMFKIYEQPND